MFFSAPPVVEVVDHKENQMVFLSPKPLRLGRDNSVKVSLRASEGKARVVPLKVYVQQARPVEGGQTAYIGFIDQELPFQPVTSQTSTSALRRGERMDCHLRIMSPDIATYAAISVDFSLSGLQIETKSALETGKVLRLNLETHLAELETITLTARVAWSRPEGRKAFRAGLEFHNLSAETRHQLEELARYLKLREEANITQRVLECADRYLLGYPMPEVVEEVEA